MKIIKLDAIDSTNSFLKELSQKASLDSFTVAIANSQSNGKGQMGTTWVSNTGENLLCSVYVAFDGVPITHQVLINYAVSLAIVNTLLKYDVPKVSIKWPNDILSSKSKVCGVLIENAIVNKEITSTVIGIGLNVNQRQFPETLPNATSMINLINKRVVIEELLYCLLDELKTTTSYITNETTNVLKKTYLNHLHRKNKPTMFRDQYNNVFLGMIVGVSPTGKIQIQLEDESLMEFGIKEIKYA